MTMHSKSHHRRGRDRYAVLYPLAFLEASGRLKRGELHVLLLLVVRVPFGNRGTATIRDLEDATGRCRAVLYRRLKSLEDQGFIRWKSGRWTINPNFLYKGSLHFRGDALEAWNAEMSPDCSRSRLLLERTENASREEIPHAGIILGTERSIEIPHTA